MEWGGEKAEADGKSPNCHGEKQERSDLCPRRHALSEARSPPRSERDAPAQHSRRPRQEVPPLGSSTPCMLSVFRVRLSEISSADRVALTTGSPRQRSYVRVPAVLLLVSHVRFCLRAALRAAPRAAPARSSPPRAYGGGKGSELARWAGSLAQRPKSHQGH